MAAYPMTEDESVAFVTALMGGVTWGPIPDEDGYKRTAGYRRGDQSIDRDIRMLIAAKVIVTPVTQKDALGYDIRSPNSKVVFVRGPRPIEGDE